MSGARSLPSLSLSPPPADPLPAERFPRWLTRLCALAAGGLCLWLTVQEFTGKIDSVAGCGGAEGCSQVLGGRWSAWMNVPVSTLALGFYAAVFLLTLRPVYSRHPGRTDFLLTAAAASALLAAAWFSGVLLLAEKAFCPYCAAIHALGFLWAVPVLWRAVRRRPWPSRALLTGGAAAGVLAAGQLFGPQPPSYLLTAAPAVSGVSLPPPVSKPLNPARELSFFNGSLTYRPDELPRLGARDAPHLLVEYFDYTCGSCRDMYQDLETAKPALDGKISILLLPCPLERQCHPGMAAGIPDHPGACLMARLALAVWRRAPLRFAEYHRFLMQLPLPADEAVAKSRAAEHCGGLSLLEEALADPWIDQRIKQTVREYALLSAKQNKMPKLLLPNGGVIHGSARSPAELLAVLRKQLAL